MAFDPIKSNVDMWIGQRETECIHVALGRENGTESFIEYEDNVFSGFARNVDYAGKIKNKYDVQVKKLQDILDEKNMHIIDFMSIDVEGAEMDVLNGISWNKVSISCIVMENDRERKKQRQLRKYLRRKGYKNVARLWNDDVWIRKEMKLVGLFS